MANTGLLKTHRAELVKQYIVYDGSFRPTHVYECAADTAVNGTCLLTRYLYDGTSNRVTNRKEFEATWLQAYEGSW